MMAKWLEKDEIAVKIAVKQLFYQRDRTYKAACQAY
jgi:hypothetical protein